MQTVTTNSQSSFNSETNVQIVSVFQSQMQTATSVNPTENSKSVTKFGISQFLSDFKKKTSLILNSIYSRQKNSEYTTSLL